MGMELNHERCAVCVAEVDDGMIRLLLTAFCKAIF
jgi:hypothetical protein